MAESSFDPIIENKIIDALKTVFDPEIPVNIYDLGLIYEIKKLDGQKAEISMTLTNPNCPVADILPLEVKNTVQKVEGVDEVTINLVFEPEWNHDMMSDSALLELGLF